MSIAVIFPRAIVQELLRGPSHTYLYEYNILNSRLDDIALRVSNVLQVAGYASYPVPASQRHGRDRLQSIFSHRLAARLAGLGWIGKNCCLVTPQYGPRVRLVTVLTGAPLGRGVATRTGLWRLHRMRGRLPTGRHQGTALRIDQPLRDRFDAATCTTHKDKVRDRWGKRCCGLCLASCPIGQ